MRPVIASPRPQNPHEHPPRPGDVLFRSRVEQGRTEEHTALLYECEGDDFQVIGLPESEPESHGSTSLVPRQMAASTWLLRARALDEADAQACVHDLASASGEFLGQPARWSYEDKFRVFLEPSPGMKTNCVGFVASALACSGMDALLPSYLFKFNTPLNPPERSKPTVGHLARALTGKVGLPYTPGVTDAERYASCVATYQDAIEGRLS